MGFAFLVPILSNTTSGPTLTFFSFKKLLLKNITDTENCIKQIYGLRNYYEANTLVTNHVG